jgi:hypothetical protein
VDIFTPPVRSVSQTVHVDGRRHGLSGYSYVDSNGNLFLSPALAGAPVLEYHEPYGSQPEVIPVVGEFAAQHITHIAGGPVFIAGTTFNHFRFTYSILVYNQSSLSGTPKIIHLSDVNPTQLTYDKRDDLVVLGLTKHGDSRLLIYPTPYTGAPTVRLAVPGYAEDLHFDNDENVLILSRMSRGGRQEDVVFFEPRPYRAQPTTIRTFAKTPLSVTFGVDRQLIVVYERSVLIYNHSPYRHADGQINLETLGLHSLVHAQETALDPLGNMFLLVARPQSSPTSSNYFGIWKFPPPYHDATWSTGLLRNPDHGYFGSFLVHTN